MTEDEYRSKLEAMGIPIKAPALDPSWTRNAADEPEEAAVEKREISEDEVPLDKRQASCAYTKSIITDGEQTFVDWDLQMSPVVCSSVGETTITVTSGYSVGNTVGGSVGVDFTLIKDVLKASTGINYSKTFTTSTLIAHRSPILEGNCGVIITRPTVTRRSGRQMEGCIGALKETGTWYADSHREASFGGVPWVEGFIDNCQKKQPSGVALSRCHGGGNFI